MRVRLNRVYRRFLFADLVHVLVTDVSWIVYLMLVQIIPNTRCLTFYYIFDNYVSELSTGSIISSRGCMYAQNVSNSVFQVVFIC